MAGGGLSSLMRGPHRLTTKSRRVEIRVRRSAPGSLFKADFPTLVDGNNKAKQQQQKLSPNEPGGRAARLGERFFRFTLLLLRQRYVFVYVTLP